MGMLLIKHQTTVYLSFFICVQTNIGHSIVASFITATESQSAVREALEIIKKWNVNWKPQFFMTDYDNREIDAIEGLFEGEGQNEDEETCEDDNENIELTEEDSHVYDKMMPDEDDEFEFTENSQICENSNLTFHEFAVLIMTLKTSFILSGISFAFRLKIINVV
ncbi:Hypothetical predicted protein [Mytilus galloprovincialis]|uniref:MULE transposase domain-containing protein n=1 Tax=Mytilus galloprovincialis TaxID=29158 RepID=A0A8B6F089_MYTGA|nr:Hypothetical predicted protein [Mytilus galloprovincialis]